MFYGDSVTMFSTAILFPLAVAFNFNGLGFVFGMLFGTVLMMGLPAMDAITRDVVTSGMKGLAGECVFWPCMLLAALET